MIKQIKYFYNALRFLKIYHKFMGRMPVLLFIIWCIMGTWFSNVSSETNIRSIDISSEAHLCSGVACYSATRDGFLGAGIGLPILALVATVAALFPARPTDAATLVARWSFNDGSGSSVADSSVNNNTGTATGSPTWTTGPQRGALSFNGNSQYVRRNSLTGMNSGNAAHSIAAWIKVTALPANRAWILMLGRDTAGSHHWLINSRDSTQFGVWGSSQGVPVLTGGNWKHVAMTFDGINLKTYVNGDSVGTIAATFNLPATCTLTVAQAHNSENHFNGLLDDVRVYNGALTTAEVKALSYYDFTWVGLGADSNWSTGANWQGGVAPGVNDTAIFTSATTRNCYININAALKGITMLSGWTGKLVQNAGITITIGSNGYKQAGGMFIGNNARIADSASFTLMGGSFTSTNDTLLVNGAVFNLSAGTFTHNNGKVLFRGTSGVTATPGTNALNIVRVDKISAAVTLGSNLTLAGALNVTGGTFDQGASYGLKTGGAITVASGGTWRNMGSRV